MQAEGLNTTARIQDAHVIKKVEMPMLLPSCVRISTNPILHSIAIHMHQLSAMQGLRSTQA